MNANDLGLATNAPSPEFTRGAQWPAIIVKVNGFSNVSVVPKFLWTKMDIMERCLLASGLKKVPEPLNNHSYVALFGDRPMRVIFFVKKGIRFEVFSIDTSQARSVQELYELPEQFSPDHVPSFSRRVSLCPSHRPNRMEFQKFKTLLEDTYPYLNILVTKDGDPTGDGSPPEVLFLDEFCMDLVESHGLSGAVDWTEASEENLSIEFTNAL